MYIIESLNNGGVNKIEVYLFYKKLFGDKLFKVGICFMKLLVI